MPPDAADYKRIGIRRAGLYVQTGAAEFINNSLTLAKGHPGVSR